MKERLTSPAQPSQEREEPFLFGNCSAHPYYREKPILIIEVLSESTERIDRTEKRGRYQLIPELKEYLLVAQDYPKVEIDRRERAWRCEEYFIEHNFHLDSVDMSFQMREGYRRIKY